MPTDTFICSRVSEMMMIWLLVLRVLLGREKFDLDRSGWNAFEVVVRSHQRRVLAQRQRSGEGVDKWNLKVVLEDGRVFGEILVRRNDRYGKGSEVRRQAADVHPIR